MSAIALGFAGIIADLNRANLEFSVASKALVVLASSFRSFAYVGMIADIYVDDANSDTLMTCVPFHAIYVKRESTSVSQSPA